MAIRNILVAYNGSDSSDAALRLGLLMARKYDAHLTGVLAHGMPRVMESAMPWLTEGLSREFAEIARRMKGEVYAAITDKFRALTDASDLGERLHWLDIEGSTDATIMELARCFDITLVGEHQQMTGEEQIALHPDLVALQSGRPVLIVPRGYEVTELNEHAVLAWDGTRAASRAMSDAMQILETKSLVTILSVGAGDIGAGYEGADIETHLQRHGVATERVRIPRKGSVGDTIVDYCRDRGAGILVMGAYEHSKFSEDLLGGVTNEVLLHSAIPVLMSH